MQSVARIPVQIEVGDRMAEKTLPFTKAQMKRIMEKHPTPFHIYCEEGIRETARRLNKAFSWVPEPGFKNYFAVKACPNPHILRILREEGFGVDCSSLPELIISERVGFDGEDIMFSSNDTPAEEFVKARELGAIINLDDIAHIPFLEKHAGIPDLICFRHNPGSLRKGSNIIGDPVEAKFGLTTDQIFEAYRMMRDKGVKRFGLHTMVVSNMINCDYLIETGKMLFDLVLRISRELDINFEFVNTGGGIGIPYRPEEKPVDLDLLGKGIRKAYEEKILANKLSPLRVIMEAGRAITGPHGYLVSRVRHVTKKYRDFVGLDACMANLMRPAMYGAYHHITVLGKEEKPKDHVYDVTGSLCENNDKFAIQRHLPEITPEDIVVIHDTGAHGYAMGFQYNGKLRSAELLLRPNGEVRQIRRAETVEDYLATLDF